MAVKQIKSMEFHQTLAFAIKKPMNKDVATRLFTVPYFSVGFSRFMPYDLTAANLVHKSESECNLVRVSKLPRGAGVTA